MNHQSQTAMPVLATNSAALPGALTVWRRNRFRLNPWPAPADFRSNSFHLPLPRAEIRARCSLLRGLGF